VLSGDLLASTSQEPTGVFVHVCDGKPV